jgi:acyl dehydratase
MSPRFEEVVPGSEPAPWTVGPFTRTDLVRYQGASGDMNPVHHDEVFAKAAGFPAPLGVGMYTAGCMNTWATDWLGPANVRSTRIRWKKPVFPGTMVTFSGAVTGRDPQTRRVELTLQGVDQDGAVVVQGWMSFELGDHP